jgi:hypothetical protein
VLWGLRQFEERIELYQLAELCITIAGNDLAPQDLRQRLEGAKFHVKSISIAHDVSEHCKTFECQVRWPSQRGRAHVPAVLAELERLPGLLKLQWKSISTAPN